MPNERVEAPATQGLSKEQFIAELRAASVRAGQRVGRTSSVFELGRLLNVQQRRLQRWLAGDGPTWNTMQAMYPRIRTVARPVAREAVRRG